MIELVLANGGGALLRDGLVEHEVTGSEDRAQLELVELLRQESRDAGQSVPFTFRSVAGVASYQANPDGTVVEAWPATPVIPVPPVQSPVPAVAQPAGQPQDTPLNPLNPVTMVPAASPVATAAVVKVTPPPFQPSAPRPASDSAESPLTYDWGITPNNPAPATLMDRQLTYLVGNIRGGAGKTVTSVLLASAFGHMRGGDVGVIDLNPTGNLTSRMSVPDDGPTILEMLDTIGPGGGIPPWGQLTRLFAWDEQARAHVIGSRRSVMYRGQKVAAHVSGDEVRRILAACETGFKILGLDSGNNDAEDALLAAAGAVSQLVVPVKLDVPTVVDGSGRMLQNLHALGHRDLVLRAIIVVTHGPRERPDRRQAARFRAEFVAKGHAVFDIPVDPHLHAKGPIVWERLRPATRQAATALAAEILRRHEAAQ